MRQHRQSTYRGFWVLDSPDLQPDSIWQENDSHPTPPLLPVSFLMSTGLEASFSASSFLVPPKVPILHGS